MESQWSYGRVTVKLAKAHTTFFNLSCHVYLISIYVKLASSLYHCLNYGFMRNKESWNVELDKPILRRGKGLAVCLLVVDLDFPFPFLIKSNLFLWFLLLFYFCPKIKPELEILIKYKYIWKKWRLLFKNEHTEIISLYIVIWDSMIPNAVDFSALSTNWNNSF